MIKQVTLKGETKNKKSGKFTPLEVYSSYKENVNLAKPYSVQPDSSGGFLGCCAAPV
jgi:hypothetical protein